MTLTNNNILNLKWLSIVLMAVVFSFYWHQGVAQQRVKPSKAYMAGDTIQSPLYGIQLVLPKHWNGFLTQGTEVFSLSSDTTMETTLMIFPSEEDLQDIEKRWNGQVELSPGVEILPVEPPRIISNKLQSEFSFSGNENRMGYSIAQCGDYGFCYTAFLITNKAKGPYYQDTMERLSQHISFFEPTLTDFYGDYQWANELTNKYMVTYESAGYSTKQNHLWLCEDGTFQAQIKRKGGFKGTTGNYKGKQKGTYQIEGIGATGKLVLNFEKLSPLELPLEIKEEAIFMNGLRYSVMENSKCR